MPTLADLRKEYPSLAGLDDNDAVDVIHDRFYADLPRDQVAGALGVKPPEPEKVPATTGSVVKDAAKSFAQGALELPEQLTGLADVVPALVANKRPFTAAADYLGDATGFKPGTWAREIQLSPQAQQSQKEIDDTWANKDSTAADIVAAYVKHPAYVLNMVAQSAPSMVAGGLGGRALMAAGRVAPAAEGAAALPGYLERAAGKWAPGIAGGVGEGSQQVGQQMAQGADNPDQRRNAIAALASGGIDAAIGAGAGRVANALGLETFQTAMAGGKRTGAVLGPMARIAGGGAEEALLEELPQSAQEQVWQNWADNKPLYDGVPRQAIEGALAGLAMGGLANVRGEHAGAEQPDAVPAPPPVTGPLSRAANANPNVAAAGGLDAVTPPAPGSAEEAAAAPAQPPAVDPVLERIKTLEGADRGEALAAYNLLSRDDTPKGVRQYNSKLLDDLLAKLEPQEPGAAPVESSDPAALLSQGMNADPLQQALASQRDEQTAQANLATWMQRAAPLPLEQAQGIQEAGAARGYDLSVVPHSAGQGFTVIPSEWVTPAMRSQVATAIPMDAAPTGVLRADAAGNVAPETRVQAIDTQQAADAAAAESARKNALGLTPDVEAVQAGAKRAPLPIAQAGDVTLKSGEPFKNKGAAMRAQAKTGAGTVLQVQGGWVVRTQPTQEVSDVRDAGATGSVASAPAGQLGGERGGSGSHADVPGRGAGGGAENVSPGPAASGEAGHAVRAGAGEPAAGVTESTAPTTAAPEIVEPTKHFQPYTSEQRADRAASHRMTAGQKAQQGETFWTHPMAPGIAFKSRAAALRAAREAAKKPPAEPVQQRQPEGTPVNDMPSKAPGERWTTDRGAMPGEPFAYLDGDAETGVAAMREVESPGRGTSHYEVHDTAGQLLASGDTEAEAARLAEKRVDAKPATAPAKTQGEPHAQNADGAGRDGGVQPATAAAAAADTAVRQGELTKPEATGQTEKRAPKPRMGETADALWAAIKKDSTGVVHEGRIIVPTLRVVGGDDFKLNAQGKLEVVDRKNGGVGVRDATDAEADEFHRDLNEDRVRVLLMSAPGYGSGYKQQKVLKELHSPSGLGFKGKTSTATTEKSHAAEQVPEPSGVRAEPENGDRSGQAAEAGAGDRVQRAEGSEEGKTAPAAGSGERDGGVAAKPRDGKTIAREIASARPFDSYEDVRKAVAEAIAKEAGSDALTEAQRGFLRNDLSEWIHAGQYEGIRAWAEKLPVPVLESQISRETAMRSHEGTSHSPQERGQAEIRSYVRALAAVWRGIEGKYAAADQATQDRVREQFQKLRDGYVQRVNAYLAAHGRVMSSMIAGPARFPVESNRKKSDAADRRGQEAQDFLAKGKKAIARAFAGPVDNSLHTELASIQSRIAAAEALQEKMKAANAALRKGDDAALRALGFDDAKIAELKKPDFAGRTGFPDFALKNNNAEIRRLKERQADVQKRIEGAQAAQAVPQENDEGGPRIVQDAEANRVRILFDGKPDDATRNALKAAGFRWSPTNSAWQRQLTTVAVKEAQRIVDATRAAAPTEGTKFSRTEENAGRAMTAEQLQDLADAISMKWANAPEIVVVPNMDDPRVPLEAREDNGTQQSQGAVGRPAGFFYGPENKVFLVASEIHSPLEAITVLAHESLGHFGLRGFFGDAGLVPILQQIAAMRRKEVLAKAEAYGLDPKKKGDLLQAAEEVLAEMAQSTPQIGFVKRAVAAIRTWLRKNVPGFKNLALTDDEIVRSFILPARGWVVRGEGTGAARPGGQTQFARVPARDEGDFQHIALGDKVLLMVGGRSHIEAVGHVIAITDARFEVQFPAVPEAGIDQPFREKFRKSDGRTVGSRLMKFAQRAGLSGAAMFSRTAAQSTAVGTNSPTAQPLHREIMQAMNDTLNAPGKLNWWHKSIGTQYNLAQRSPEYKRVFDATQDFIQDVSLYATEAADLAPQILPKLETWKDIGKAPIAPQDNKAISAPIFEGTLLWGRDERGQPVKVDDLRKQAETLSAEAKAQRMLRAGAISENVLKMWKGLPIDQYEASVASRYESQMLKAGVVWSDDELRKQFKLTEPQIALYHEFRNATDRSITSMAISDMVRYAGKDIAPEVRQQVLDSPDVDAAALMLRDHLLQEADRQPDRKDVLIDAAEKMVEKADRARELMDRGYAPLSRFGHYTVDVIDKNGQRVYFGMFENAREAALMARKMRGNFPEATITRGTVSQEEYKLFAGVSPETVELFGELLGLEGQGDDAASKAFQTYIKVAKANRSAMKRLIERKGIAGFSEDVGRVLAGFVYSNARQTSQNLHMGEMTQAASDIPKEKGELKDQATRLVEYVKNPQEEAQGLRGLLFAQYLGGSVASAMVNMLQPVQVTLPYLSQFGGAAKAASRMTRAFADVRKKTTGDKALDAALKRAEEEGIVAPQEVFQLMAQARGRGLLRSGDGTVAGNARAKASNAFSRLTLAWGKVFGAAEQINRRVTFIAAYRTAMEQGIAHPEDFAAKAVAETQFVYGKQNKPNWARGAVGGVLFTFKQYGISYLELLHRMATQGGPQGKRAALLALGMLFLFGGAGGLPFADDLDDLIDGVMQRLGYNFSSKLAKKQFFQKLLGKDLGQFAEHGVSGLPGVPIDVSGRLGMGNLIPGTGLLVDKQDHTSDVTEFLGAGGDFAKRIFTGANKLAQGDLVGAAGDVAPRAAANAQKALEMYTTGQYKDANGRKVIDVDGYDALAKAIGFQPTPVAQVQEATGLQQQLIAEAKLASTRFADAWAKAVADGDSDALQKVRQQIAQWNRDNPDTPVVINRGAIMSRVKSMREDKATRIEKTAPRAIRANVRAALAPAPEAAQ